MSFNNDFDLWTGSPASGYLSPPVHHVWRCQADLPKWQLGSCLCVAKKTRTAHALQRKIQAPQGTVETFCRLLLLWQVEAWAEWSSWGEASDLTESCSNQVATLARTSDLPNPLPAIQDAPLCDRCDLRHSVFLVWSANPLPTHYTDPRWHQDPIPFPLSTNFSQTLFSAPSLFQSSLKQSFEN